MADAEGLYQDIEPEEEAAAVAQANDASGRHLSILSYPWHLDAVDLHLPEQLHVLRCSNPATSCGRDVVACLACSELCYRFSVVSSGPTALISVPSDAVSNVADRLSAPFISSAVLCMSSTQALG